MLRLVLPLDAGGWNAAGALAPHADPTAPFLLALATALPLVTPAVMPMYRRLVRRRVLATPMRRAVLDAFARAPGSTVAAVAGRLDVDYKTVQHHARVLREFRLLGARRDGRVIRYYPIAGPGAVSATRTLK